MTRNAFVLLAFAVAGVMSLARPDRGRPAPTALDEVNRLVRAFDEPDAAAAYYAARRAPLSADLNPQERYRTALERRSRMPRYSTARSRRLPSFGQTDARPAPLVWPSVLGRRGAAQAPGSLDAWIPLGPGNIGGRTRVLRFDPDNPERMYAGGVSGGVWKTEDAGASWYPVGDNLANLAVNSMAISPRDPRVLYVGTGEGYFREDVRNTGLPLRGAGIFATADGGDTWSQLSATATADFQFVNDLFVSPRDDRVLYAATRTGVWRSRDRGASWEPILPTTVRGGCLDLALRTDGADDVLFAACGSFEQATVYRSLDARGAAVFAPVLSDPGMGRTTLAIAPSDQNIIYALSASNLPGPGELYEQALHAVFRSSAGGAAGTWVAQVRNTDAVKLRTLILTNPIAASYADCRLAQANAYIPMGWYVASLAVDPIDSDTVWAAGVDWFRSRDGGRSWGVVSEWWNSRVRGFVHADQHDLVFHPGYNGTTNQQAFALTDGGVFRTDNARALDSRDLCNASSIQVAWTSLNHGFGVTQFYHGLPFPDGEAYLGGAQDNGTLLGTAARGPDGWAGVSGGDGGYVAIDPSRPNVIYVESQWADIQRSDDGGRTFADAGNGLGPRGPDNLQGARANFLFVAPFVVDSGQPWTMWTGGRYVYRRDETTEAGEDGATVDAVWRRASERLLGDGLVSAIAVAPADSSRVSAGASDGRVYVTDAGRSSPDAIRWDVAQPRAGWVTSVAYDAGDPEVVYATYGGFGGAHVFRSTNGGRTWRAIDGTGDTGIPDVPAHVIAADPGRVGRLYLGTDVGVFVSDSGGDSWAAEKTGFGAVVTEWLAPLQTPTGERWLFAFTHGRGAWKVKLTR